MRRQPQKSAIPKAAEAEQIGSAECYLVAEPAIRSAALDGNIARRSLPSGIIWDDTLPGFGLRIRPTGHKAWIVKYRERRQQRFVTLGPSATLEAPAARARARALLERAALDGLLTRRQVKVAPSFREYVDEFWRDYAHHWKPATARSNAGAIRRELTPVFGDLTLDAIARADVLRWRADLAERQGVFNRALPVLAVMLVYAEQLGYRRKGSNPCKGTPRYKRELPDRFLSPREYQRLGRVLADAEGEMPLAVAAIRLLMFTGARSNEIASLRWTYVQPPRLMLPDSKTGAKVIYLNGPAMALLDALPRGADERVFPSPTGCRELPLWEPWDKLRRRAALPDVRLHDLRHSFASVAIADGIPLTMIGKLLGHALPETTARYAHLADTVIADAAERVCGGIADALGFAP